MKEFWKSISIWEVIKLAGLHFTGHPIHPVFLATGELLRISSFVGFFQFGCFFVKFQFYVAEVASVGVIYAREIFIIVSWWWVLKWVASIAACVDVTTKRERQRVRGKCGFYAGIRAAWYSTTTSPRGPARIHVAAGWWTGQYEFHQHTSSSSSSKVSAWRLTR